MEIVGRNVNDVFSDVFWNLKALCLKPTETRNGPAIVVPGVVTSHYRKPQERVLFNRDRDCNPVFHLMESIWMLAGRNDVGFLTQFNKRMSDFSDDGVTYNAAYGYRWRRHFGFDQLEEVINIITNDPASRQAVVQIWDPEDLRKQTKDKACNTEVVFDTRNGSLNMTVFNRSNDIWWGAYGANAVHFSFMQEFMAHALSLPVGPYRQISHNLHLYVDLYDAVKHINNPPSANDGGYYGGEIYAEPIMKNNNWRSFLEECELFCDDPFLDCEYAHDFFNNVARPMAMVSRSRKKKLSDGRDWANRITAPDWRLAALNWIEKREQNKMNRGG